MILNSERTSTQFRKSFTTWNDNGANLLVGMTLAATLASGSFDGAHASSSLPPSESAQPAKVLVSPPSNDPIIHTMEVELKRTIERLKTAGKAPVYYLAYRLYDCKWDTITGANGALLDDVDGQCRMLSVDLRVGNRHFDNTHFLRGKNSASPHYYEKSTERESVLSSVGSGIPLQQCLWLKSDEAFKEAQQRYAELLASNDVMSAEEDKSDDFSVQPARHYESPIKKVEFDRDAWRDRIRRLSKIFASHPHLLQTSTISFMSEPTTRYFVNTEGSQIVEQHLGCHVFIQASTLAGDGMTLWLWDSIDCPEPSMLPSEATIAARVETLVAKLEKLRAAPVAEAFVGPAILSGKAAAVFYHETFGHRAEALHEKSENEGKTFARRIGTQIMPSFISITDDPTTAKAEGQFLNGYYVFDDEGVPAQSVSLTKNGILKGFLVSRTLVQGVAASNGHGRSSPGWNPVARQGNLIVSADKSKQVSPEALRAMLIAEAKKQHKEYGLLFDEISGGATYTVSKSDQTYYVNPLVVYRVFVDGRPDQLIRGADIVGTPLAALEKVIAAGNDRGVFNGKCGRESGPVPVSGIAPSLLIQSLETKRTAKTFDKVPILPDPTTLTHEK